MNYGFGYRVPKEQREMQRNLALMAGKITDKSMVFVGFFVGSSDDIAG
jgi:hypothetical protein